MKSTDASGSLQPIPNCDIIISGRVIRHYVLPEISDSKGAHYNDEPIMGRSLPIKTFGYGESRNIGMKIHFIVQTDADASRILADLRHIQSATYPRENAYSQFAPPPICKIRCGRLLSGGEEKGYLCAVLKQYSVTYPTDVAWYVPSDGQGEYVPHKFSVDLTWDVVYPNETLPGQESIMNDI